MDLPEFIRMTTIINRLAKRALFAEKQMVALEGQCAEWRRIVDELKAERDAERKAHNEYKERNRELFNQNQRLTAELVVIKDERDALRAQLDTERKAKTVDVPQAHSVKVPDWVRRTAFEHGPNTKIGTVAKVVDVDIDGDYRVAINDTEVCWRPAHCTPCDPPPEETPDLTKLHAKGKAAWADVPSATQFVEELRGNTEASHDTPAGKETAQAAAEPKPGDVVRLVRVPTPNEYPHDTGRWEPNWGGIGDYMRVHHVGSNINGTRIVRAVFGLEWPLSCVEVVKGGDK